MGIIVDKPDIKKFQKLKKKFFESAEIPDNTSNISGNGLNNFSYTLPKPFDTYKTYTMLYMDFFNSLTVH